jgi:PII-like signaling protein
MQGYQLTFYTQQDRTHKRLPLAQWIVEEARRLGIGGATMTSAAEGFGRDKKVRSAAFFELSNQPLQVTMAVSESDAERIFDKLKEEEIDVFYVKIPVEYGMTGQR